MVLRSWKGGSPSQAGFTYWCPGCNEPHQVRTEGLPPRWGWNGSLDSPTFTPSIRVTYYDGRICHCFVKEGYIEFLGDSFHNLKDTTVKMVDITNGWPWKKD